MVFVLGKWVIHQLIPTQKPPKTMKTHLSFSKPSPKPTPPIPYPYPSVTKCNTTNRASNTIVLDINQVLLRTNSFFPYFMLVAFEGGGLIRSFILLTSSLFLWFLNHEMQLKLMIFITFCGLKTKTLDSVGKAVLPKFYLENLNVHVLDVLGSCGAKYVFTCVPRVLVEGFLKEFLRVDGVVGTELHSFAGYFTGWVSGSGILKKHKVIGEYFGDFKPDIGIGSSNVLDDVLFLSHCKEQYVVTSEDRTNPTSITPRNKYPKPLIFHDGRLAFLPTPLSTLTMFLYLPLGIILSLFRILIGILLPYKLSLPIATKTGITITLTHKAQTQSNFSTHPKAKGVLFVCTHRTLLDPVFLSTALSRPITAVTYSLSKMSELIAPIKTVRLTRNRAQDASTMNKLLSEGDLVVCPEGTTCREPYLLRFSSLFAELTDEIVPVAVNTRVDMFYGTTASGFKWLDPVFFLMNPKPVYEIVVLDKIGKERSCGSGQRSCDVANYVQRLLGDELGFECTSFTRRDKYLMLAGNDGVVKEDKKGLEG